MKNCPKVYKNCQSKLEILPNTKLTLSKWPKFLNDVCQSGEISPNLVTLAAAHPTSPVLFSWMKRFDLLQLQLPLASLHCQFFFEASSNPHARVTRHSRTPPVRKKRNHSLSLSLSCTEDRWKISQKCLMACHQEEPTCFFAITLVETCEAGFN